ncbi:MAG: type II toxin-antitoxin system Phd/YefM family antitoxin [Marinilabiliaceae bacterium]|nr:type II toxin-antitoxin system Phd/YefM family antitoxin [Marinilabiliaceae bacterium]
MNLKFSIFVPSWYALKRNIMLVISSREFRQNQKLYFERADKGEQIIVQRGKDKAYALTPISEEDVYFNAEMVERIKQSIKQVEEGKVKRVTTPEGISDLLGL